MFTSNGYTLDESPSRLARLEPVPLEERGDLDALWTRLRRDGYLFLTGFLDPALVTDFRRFYFDTLRETGIIDPDADPQLAPAGSGDVDKAAYRRILTGALTLASSDGSTTATFLPGSNLVCSELRFAGADWLDPVRALESVATGKDYGISLVHPWAGRLERFGYEAAGSAVELPADAESLKLDKQGLPIHGVRDAFLRWQVEEATWDRVTARMEWSDSRLLDVFPYPHELRVTATVGTARLDVVTELTPLADAAVPVSFGYHAFLRIPKSPRASWTLDRGSDHRTLVDATQIPTGQTEEVVREYGLGDAGVNEDAVGLEPGARLAFGDEQSTVTMVLEEGYTTAHIFAPAEWNLVSFEPQIAPANALNSGHGLTVVKPGRTFRAAFAIVISS